MPPEHASGGFFDGFTLEHVRRDDVSLRVRHGGAGPPVLLLHGHPRTHTTWHRVAPLLARQHTVVCPDLRGYGQSSKPDPAPDHVPYSKRQMATDNLALMRALGHERFAVVGHDRGSYVAFRLAMDHPEVVSHLAVLDGVPIGEALARCDASFAKAWWHWFFLGNRDAHAHDVISADPVAWYTRHGKQAAMGEESLADFQQAVADPATVRAMCEDYRAGLTIDRAHDDADRARGRRVQCPVLVAAAEQDDLFELYGDPVAVWQDWAVDVRGVRIDAGHHMAEEAPDELATHLLEFLALSSPAPPDSTA